MTTREQRISFFPFVVLTIALTLIFSGCEKPVTTSQSPRPAAAPSYDYGTVVTFALGGQSEMYRTAGWSKTEEKFTWTEGQSASLTMDVKPSATPVTMRMRLAGLINPPDLPFQLVEVFLNEEKVAEWQVADTADFTAAIPKAITEIGGTMKIALKIPKASTPKALGQGNDPRMLGICCFEFELSQTL